MDIEKCEGVYKAIQDVLSSIDLCQPSLQIALFFALFNPFYWNAVSRLEYYTRIFTKITGSPRLGCYIFAITVFSLGMVRSYFFKQALRKQMVTEALDSEFLQFIGIVLAIGGQVLVLCSMYQLGITGTYNGDYFGILMKEIVNEFPFNICYNPMYRGSTLSFLGVSLFEGKAAGLLVTIFVHLAYELALKFEEPFTVKIYAAPKKD